MCRAAEDVKLFRSLESEGGSWSREQQAIDSQDSQESCCFDFKLPSHSSGCTRSSSEHLPQPQDLEYEHTLHEQELSSAPAKQYVQQLYCGGPTQAAAVRSSTIDWMVDTAQQLKLTSDSLFLGVQLLDRFLAAVLQECADVAAAQAFLQSGKLQLSALTALWVAAKFEESCVPGASTFVQHMPGASHGNCRVLLQQLLEAEQVMLTTVDHRLAAPTAKTFLRRYLARVAVSHPVYFAAGYVAELSLLDSGMLCFLPSMVAASAYVWGLKLMGIECNDEHLTRLSGYSLSKVLPCLLRVARVHIAACNTQLPCAISCKYLDDKLEQVAALPPVEQHKVVQLEQQQLLLLQQQQQQQLYQCQVKGAAAACSNSC
ncbi:hypothetical protein OEZ86_001436 [Tetradesmus obliquus]|nr:hypothetical protein OEZ86_001436 [Tetradesmus obliquus]